MPRTRRATLAIKPAEHDSRPRSTYLEGSIQSFGAGGTVTARLDDGRTVSARVSAESRRDWLRAALKLGPMAAVLVRTEPSGTYIVWGTFPSPEQEAVVVDVEIRGKKVKVTAEELEVDCRNSKLILSPKGDVRVRGRDIETRARRVNAVRGGAVRLN